MSVSVWEGKPEAGFVCKQTRLQCCQLVGA